MNRSLKLSILMALALGSTQAAAVELGQAHVKSALGQPLLVDIPVIQVTPAEAQSLNAQLASNDAFAKVGGERPTIPLQFSVTEEGGHKVIRVTSSAPVSDPYLDLLVEVTSTTGSTVREFPILLDPPGKVQAAASSAPARRRAPVTSTSAPASETSAPAPRQTAAASGHHAAEVKGGQVGPVEHGATLSHVASEVAPSMGVDTNQMMLALKSANPDAFYRDNINALKAGAILRVPSREDAQATSAAAALAAVRQQNSDWRNGATTTPVAVEAGGTRSNASVAPTQTSNADKLALVPPSGEGQAAGGANGKGNAAIRQELQRSQETLSALQQQSTDLKSRLKDLEDLNGKNQRLLSLKDNEIADLQKQLADARKTAGAPAAPAAAAPVAPAAPAPAPAPVKPAQPAAAASTHVAQTVAPAPVTKPATPAVPVSSSTAQNNAAVTTPLNAPAPAKPKPVSHPPVRPVPAPAVAEEPWYTQTWAMALGGGVIVLALAALLLSRRGKSGGKPVKSKAAFDPGNKGGSLADRFGTADLDNLDHGSGSDPDQDELLDQLAEQPDDIGLHLELVSLYYTRRDVEHFEAAAEAMHAHINDPNQPEWQDVVHMGEDLAPGHPLFAQADIPPSAHDEQSPLHHFDLDSYASDKPAAQEPAIKQAPPPLPSKVSEYHFDFDLTPHHAEPTAPVIAPASAAPKQDLEEEPLSWKFDEPAETEHEAAHETSHAAVQDEDFGELHDDPIDTKLDLARAYLDMGDPDGARAMLEEVMHEGTQMQKDVAQTLLAKIR
jgi:pilus assembly protein FimV